LESSEELVCDDVAVWPELVESVEDWSVWAGA
jgi:hypothetical protein